MSPRYISEFIERYDASIDAFNIDNMGVSYE
jgi:hypothetical protein